jgi:hypothetical protein
MFDSDSVVAVRSVVNGMMTPTARMDHPVVTTERTATTKSESNSCHDARSQEVIILIPFF